MISSWPEVILHLDADAFFASVTQAVRPELKGKPVVTGWERGIATAVSYEAKALGITRGMQCWKIQKEFPQVTITHSDYKLYHLFSDKMFSIIRRYSPTVEVYSVDEGFADLKGLRRPLHMSYEQIAKTMKDEIESSLGITVSLGVSVTKSLAKIAANINKPSGLTMVPGQEIDNLLKQTSVEKIWGIGHQTSTYLYKLNIRTAYEFTRRPESFIKQHFSRPYHDIWQELNGIPLFHINTSAKREYKSITRSQTVTPATNHKEILWARLLAHTEDAFLKARNYHYSVGRVHIYLKTQKFTYQGIEIKLPQKVSYPILIRKDLRDGFEKIYKSNALYRAAGVTISDFSEDNNRQASLFDNTELEEKAKKVYPIYESKKVDFATSLYENERNTKKRKAIKLSIPVISRLE